MSAIHKDIIEATRYFLKLVELGSYSSVKKYYNVEQSGFRQHQSIKILGTPLFKFALPQYNK